MKQQNKNRLAFTLTEVLITLGIVGVVSVLTIPNVISNYQKKVYVTKLQKVYNQLSNAVSTAVLEDNADTLMGTILAEDDGPRKFLSKYFKITKKCGSSRENDVSECFATLYTDINKTEKVVPAFIDRIDCYAVKLITGASICISKHNSTDVYSDDGSISRHAEWAVYVDTNASEGPNIKGRDFYGFYLYSDGVMGAAYSLDVRDSHAFSYCRQEESWDVKIAYGVGCLDRIINSTWKMDY